MLQEIDLPGKKDSLALWFYFTHTNPFIKDSESESSQSSLPLSDSNDSDALNFEKNNSCIGGPESESKFLPFFNQIPEDIFNSDNRDLHFLQKKRSKDSNEIKKSIDTINNEEKNNQDISTKNKREILMSIKENEFQKSYEGNLSLKEDEFQVKFVTNMLNQDGPNDVKNSKNSGSERGQDKDNFSIKLFYHLNHWVLEKLNFNSNKKENKIHTPNHYIFTHDTNLVDIYVFLDIQYKNFLCMTPKDKEALDQLLFDLEIKKQNQKKETQLTKKSKDYKYVIKLLSMDKYIINEKELPNIGTINNLYIKLLKEYGLKDKNENVLYKEDNDKFSQLLIQKGIKGTLDLQKKNQKNLKDKDNIEINMTLRQLIQEYFKFHKKHENFKKNVEEIDKKSEKKYSYENFKKDVEKIDKKFENQKKYSLLDMDEKGNIGFIRMIEEDCGLNNEQKKKVKKLTDYFLNKELNVAELQEYRKIAIPK